MPIKINKKILSIPPYLSTTWHQIASIHSKETLLIVTLYDGNTLDIPGLSDEEKTLIFDFHAEALESDIMISHEEEEELPELQELIKDMSESSFRLGFATPMAGSGMVTQHNSALRNSPELPKEVLAKIITITKILNDSDEMMLSEAHEDCNCFHCQISRGLERNHKSSVQETDIVVCDAELEFQQWIIKQLEPHLFGVINKLDQNEKYQVFLGEPVGCTCGKTGCEHILAVLKS